MSEAVGFSFFFGLFPGTRHDTPLAARDVCALFHMCSHAHGSVNVDLYPLPISLPVLCCSLRSVPANFARHNAWRLALFGATGTKTPKLKFDKSFALS